MSYIVHPRKIIHVVEPGDDTFTHFTDRYGRFVIYCIPPGLPEAEELVMNVFNGNKDQDALIERLKKITFITDLCVVFTGSKSECRHVGYNNKVNTYKRIWRNTIIGVQEGKVEIESGDKLLYLGWANEHTSNFLEDQFKFDPTKGETVNWRQIEHGLETLRAMDTVRTHTVIERPMMDQQVFDANETAPKPLDLVNDDEN